ncbi:MAG: response regulator transcription factor [Bacillota bacterium]
MQAGQDKILIVDDDDSILELITLYLRKDGFEVISARDGGEALQKIEQYNPDLVVLDIMMPVKDGWEVCKEIQQRYRLPVIMLTARSEDYDKILGLELGADDYITKPFNPRELVARIKAVLRRTRQDSAAPRLLRYQELKVNLDEYTVTKNDRPVSLTRKELELLWLLASQPNQVFSREQLLSQIWGYTYTGDTRTVDTHIKRLRRKLGESKSWDIKTVWAVGYKFEVHTH